MRSTARTTTAQARSRCRRIFGMNFQAVSVGQKLIEKSVGRAAIWMRPARPATTCSARSSSSTTAIGKWVIEAEGPRACYESTLIIITAKHGQSPIDPNALRRSGQDQQRPFAGDADLESTARRDATVGRSKRQRHRRDRRRCFAALAYESFVHRCGGSLLEANDLLPGNPHTTEYEIVFEEGRRCRGASTRKRR